MPAGSNFMAYPMTPELSPEDIDLYLRSVVIPLETPKIGKDGHILLMCRVRSQPPHDICMDPKTGQWFCLGGTCGHGDIFDYHLIRFKIRSQREAEAAVLKIIRDARERIRQAEEARKAARYASVESCDKSVRTCLRTVDRHPDGIFRRELQQNTHLKAQPFRKALRELERRGLMRKERQKCRGRTTRMMYFPVALAAAVSGASNPSSVPSGLPSR
jgi:hypothetical protein